MKAFELEKQKGKGALELIEEAFQLLRISPGVFAGYYLGTIPFMISLLYFWADMSQGADAFRRCASSALRVALLFVWMKGCHAIYARKVLDQLSGNRQQNWSWRRIAQVFLVQAIIQPSAFLILPMAFLVVIPFGWAYAFYQNILLYDPDDPKDSPGLAQKAWQRALLWPGQNHILLSILLLFGLFVFLNVCIGLVFIPSMLKTLLGIETPFSQSSSTYLNTTFLAVTSGIAFLLMDPVVKACYILRCFYADSIHTGADLASEIRSLQPIAKRVLTVAICCMLFTRSAQTQEPAAAPKSEAHSASRISSKELNASIERTIEKPDYNWRMPREKAPEDDRHGIIATTIINLTTALRQLVGSIFRAIGKVLEWLLKKLMRDGEGGQASQGGPNFGFLQTMLYTLLAIVGIVIAVLVYRIIRRRPAPVQARTTTPTRIPDLNEEEVNPADLPVQEWLTLARELMQKGELRLALRAIYLAGLASLAIREWIRVAAFKSNLDYRRELERRSHARPELASVFASQVTDFEKVWYGRHAVDAPGIENFTRNFERLESLAQK